MDLKHQDWEDEAPELAKIERGNPFLVPPGYFEALEGTIQSRVTLESLELGREPGFTVEDKYFETLPGKIEAAVALQELKEEMKTEGFAVPLGYFDQLNEKINQRVFEKPAKVRRLIPAWMNYAAAASITIAVGFAALTQLNRSNVSAKLSKVPDQEIVNYLELYSDQMDSQVIVENIEPATAFSDVSDNVSKQELKQYLEETSL